MNTKKIIHYRLSISRTFPAKHPKSGQETNFEPKILLAKMRQNNRGTVINAEKNGVLLEPKIHTIRGNYKLWQKRFEKIEKGEAVLELYYWTGKPYNSKCVTFATLKKKDGIGMQKLYFEFGRLLEPFISLEDSKNGTQTYLSIHEVAKNDGLIYPDFKEWFKGYDLSEPLALIYFTEFRY